MKRRIISLILAISMVASLIVPLAACGKSLSALNAGRTAPHFRDAARRRLPRRPAGARTARPVSDRPAAGYSSSSSPMWR